MDARSLTRQVEAKVKPAFRHGGERTGWIYLDGKKMLRVTLPKIHRGDVDARTANSIRKQLHLSVPDFEGLYDCPFSAADFRRHLQTIASDG